MRATHWVFFLTILASAPAVAQEEAGGQAPPRVEFDVHGLFATVGLYRTDSDFDPTARPYQPDGQSEGQVATFFRPDLRINVGESLSFFYQVELGWNAWSRNDPDQWFPGDESYPVLKHRELWGEWRFSKDIALRLGFQHFDDPSRLFLDHWAGAVRLDASWSGGEMTFLVGQLPDDTYEGVDVRDDNFVHDNVLFGFHEAIEISEKLKLDVAAYAVLDFRVQDRPLYLGTGLVGLRMQSGGLRIWAHFLVQYGEWQNSGVGGVDRTIGAWALQAGIRHQVDAFHWSLNILTLSADDDHHGNDTLGAFFGSGKNASRTLILTEDELRDRYDNLDERLATRWGGFWVNRAGLSLFDVSVGYRVASWFHPIAVIGTAVNLNGANALGYRYLGLEADLVLFFPLGPNASLYAVGQLFSPGRAASVFVNDTDRTATELLGGVLGGFTARF